MPLASHRRSLEYATIAELQKLIRDKALSPVELVEALTARIEKYEPSLHAFVTRTPEVALERARATEARLARGEALKPLDGIPYGLKDVIETGGIRTTGQSKILEHHVPARDAFVESRMKDAGGVLMGKLTTYEFAHGGPSWDLPWPPAMNPWKKGLSPRAARAAAPARRSPRAFCRARSAPTPAARSACRRLRAASSASNRLTVSSAAAACCPNTFSFDACGPMTRTVEDAAILLERDGRLRSRGSEQRRARRARLHARPRRGYPGRAHRLGAPLVRRRSELPSGHCAGDRARAEGARSPRARSSRRSSFPICSSTRTARRRSRSPRCSARTSTSSARARRISARCSATRCWPAR